MHTYYVLRSISSTSWALIYWYLSSQYPSDLDAIILPCYYWGNWDTKSLNNMPKWCDSRAYILNQYLILTFKDIDCCWSTENPVTEGIQIEVKIFNIMNIAENIPSLSVLLYHFVWIITTSVIITCKTQSLNSLAFFPLQLWISLVQEMGLGFESTTSSTMSEMS